MPQGVIKTGEVVILVAVCLVILIVSAFMISPICVGLLPIPLFLFLIYSFTKRFTWWCHIILGAACACAPLGAWVAVTGGISVTPLVLGAAVLLWVAGFDIIYGAQDVEFDRENDLHSIPAAFGVRNALIISAVFHLAAAALLVVTGILAGLGLIYYLGVGMITALLVYEHAIVSPANLKNVTIASYSINQIVSNDIPAAFGRGHTDQVILGGISCVKILSSGSRARAAASTSGQAAGRAAAAAGTRCIWWCRRRGGRCVNTRRA